MLPERCSLNNLEYPASSANSFGLNVLSRFPNSSVNGTSPSEEYIRLPLKNLFAVKSFISCKECNINIRDQISQPGSIGNSNPPLPSIKANFAGFQCMLYTSGDVATPASPIPPALESGAIVRNGTTV